MYIASQVIVLIADLILIASLQLKSKSRILLVQLLATTLFSIHFFLLNAYLGGLLAIIEAIRIITFFFIDKLDEEKVKKYSLIAASVFIVLTIISAAVEWDSWYCIIPLLGSLPINIALAQKNVSLLKSASLFQCLCHGTYMLLITSYVGAAFEFAVCLGAIVGLITHKEITNGQHIGHVH